MISNFTERLKSLRVEKNISQKKLAKELFVSQQTIAKWETDKSTPNPDTIIKIADFFHVTTDYLLGRIDYKTPLDEINHCDISKLDENKYPALDEFIKMSQSASCETPFITTLYEAYKKQPEYQAAINKMLNIDSTVLPDYYETAAFGAEGTESNIKQINEELTED